MWGDDATELVHFGGLAVAFAGFGITRFVVAGTLESQATLPFAINLVPLVVGLVFTVYGVVLAVGDFPDAYVDTVARWTFLGVSLMIVVLALTVFGMMDGPETMDAPGMFETLQGSQLFVANALLGGAIGGALTGDRAGLNRRHRNEIELQAELALIANGLLRHEVLNATSIIDGYASLFAADDSPRDADVAAIRAATDRIETTVADLGEVGRARDSEAISATDLSPILREELDAFGERYSDGSVSETAPDEPIHVLADHRLRLLLRKLLETVAERGDASTLGVDVAAAHRRIALTVRSAGGSVSEADGHETDDPAVGFDRRIVELLTGYYGGTFEIHDRDVLENGGDGAPNGLSATLELPRAIGDRPGVGRLGVSSAGLGAALISGLVGGLAMGLLSQFLSGLLPVIGALYGVPDPLAGWVTHQFHSVVFALLFAAGYTQLRGRVSSGWRPTGALIGALWGGLLWLVAAGIIMPLWLQLVGVSAVLPNLTGIGLLTHLVWGVTVGVLYAPLRGWFSSSRLLSRFRSVARRRFGGLLRAR